MITMHCIELAFCIAILLSLPVFTRLNMSGKQEPCSAYELIKPLLEKLLGIKL